MYVCMYVCMHACMRACMHACMHACKYACVYVCMYVCMHACMYVCMYACMYACMHVCMYACMHVSMYVSIYIYIYIYIGDVRVLVPQRFLRHAGRPLALCGRLRKDHAVLPGLAGDLPDELLGLGGAAADGAHRGVLPEVHAEAPGHQSYTSNGIGRQGIVLECRSSLQKSLCPVVICPYLCSSEVSCLDSYLDALQLLLWPRLRIVLDANVMSLRKAYYYHYYYYNYYYYYHH